MLIPRFIPCLLLKNASLVKTIQFQHPEYIGDPINAIRIYNEKGVDELIFLDITATVEGKPPPFQIIREIASECFMPVTYGGGIRNLDDIKQVFSLGIEKVSLNTIAVEKPDFVHEAARQFGNQSIVISIDVRKNAGGLYEVMTRGGKKSTGITPVEFAKQMEQQGAGEILLTSIDRDGTMQGYDLELIQNVTGAIGVPVIACGGARTVDDFGKAIQQGNASAAAAGSMVVYFGRNRAVLINFPSRKELEKVLH